MLQKYFEWADELDTVLFDAISDLMALVSELFNEDQLWSSFSIHKIKGLKDLMKHMVRNFLHDVDLGDKGSKLPVEDENKIYPKNPLIIESKLHTLLNFI